MLYVTKTLVIIFFLVLIVMILFLMTTFFLFKYQNKLRSRKSNSKSAQVNESIKPRINKILSSQISATSSESGNAIYSRPTILTRKSPTPIPGDLIEFPMRNTYLNEAMCDEFMNDISGIYTESKFKEKVIDEDKIARNRSFWTVQNSIKKAISSSVKLRMHSDSSAEDSQSGNIPEMDFKDANLTEPSEEPSLGKLKNDEFLAHIVQSLAKPDEFVRRASYSEKLLKSADLEVERADWQRESLDKLAHYRSDYSTKLANNHEKSDKGFIGKGELNSVVNSSEKSQNDA